MRERIERELDEAEQKAWDSLSRYKFMMFGYWAGVWVHLNRLQDATHRRPNPFKALVKLARANNFADEPDGLQSAMGLFEGEANGV